MINSARTLLLNVSYTDAILTLEWSEYVPSEFVAISLPPWLTTVRTILFGSNPTQQQLNQRVRQYLQLLHAGDFADHLLAIDSRITYLPFDTDKLPILTAPQAGLGSVLAALKTAVHSEHPLFSDVEPYRTFKNLWNKHPLGLYQLTGLLLALIYRTSELRAGVYYAA